MQRGEVGAERTSGISLVWKIEGIMRKKEAVGEKKAEEGLCNMLPSCCVCARIST